MARITALIFIVSLSCFGVSAQSLDWIVGTWERENTKPGQVFYESWEKITNKEFRGIGVRIEGSDTTFRENLWLRKEEDNWYYIAEVSHNETAIHFKITNLTEKGFTSENPDHDFPKRIEYSLEGDRMTAITSGDGHAITFIFRRKEN